MSESSQVMTELAVPSKAQDPCVDIVTFNGLDDKDRDNPVFSSHFGYECFSSIRLRHPSSPRSLVAVLYGSEVDVTQPYLFDWESKDARQFQNPPTPEEWRENSSGVQRVEYAMLHMLSQKEHPGVFARFLLAGEPVDYNFWMGRRVRKQLRFDFKYKGEDYSFNTVPAIQVAVQGLLDVVIDPGYLVHAMYQANVVQVELLNQTLTESVGAQTMSALQAKRLISQEEVFRSDLERDLLAFSNMRIPIFVMDRTLNPR